MNTQRHLSAGQKTGCRSWFFPSMIWVLEMEFRFLGSAARMLMPHWSPDISAQSPKYWDFRWWLHTQLLYGFILVFFILLWMGYFYWCFLGRFVISIQTWQWFYMLISSLALLSNIFIKLKCLLRYLPLNLQICSCTSSLCFSWWACPKACHSYKYFQRILVLLVTLF